MAKEIDVNKMREERTRKKHNKKLTIVISAVCILVVLLIAVMAAPLSYSKIYKNISVAGVNVGSMTQEEALTVLTENFSELTPKIQVTALNTPFDIDFNIIAEYNLEETAKKAYNYGKENIFSKFYNYYFANSDLPLVTSANNQVLKDELTRFQSMLPSGYVDTSYKIEDNILIVKAGKSGNAIDTDSLSEEILEALKKGKDVVINTKTTIKNYNGVDVDKLYEDVFCKPQDAYLDETGSKIITHKVGYSFDKEKAKEILKDASDGEEYKISLSVTYPDVTEDTLTGKMFGDTLASYSTKYNPGEVNRTHNMYLASSKVTGTVIAPGEVFSYNKVVGERTVAKGYRNAKVFENGQVVDGLAGGICQVSTTIYNAALYANLEIVERKNHSFPVTYAPMGQDATVAMGSIDFRFKNNTEHPIKVVSSVSGGLCTVTILGTDKNHYKVEIQNTITGTRARNVEYENDPTLEKGVEKVKQTGSDGYTIASRRIVTKNGEVIKNEAIPSSYYIPLKKIILRNEEPEGEEPSVDGEEATSPEGEEQPSDKETNKETDEEDTQPPAEITDPVTNPDVPPVTTPVQPADTPEATVVPSAPIPQTTPEADPTTGV